MTNGWGVIKMQHQTPRGAENHFLNVERESVLKRNLGGLLVIFTQKKKVFFIDWPITAEIIGVTVKFLKEVFLPDTNAKKKKKSVEKRSNCWPIQNLSLSLSL